MIILEDVVCDAVKLYWIKREGVSVISLSLTDEVVKIIETRHSTTINTLQ